MRGRALLLVALALGCSESSGDATVIGGGGDVRAADGSANDAAAIPEVDAARNEPEEEADAEPPPEPDASAPEVDPLPAAEYCERSVDVFCPYYLRCGRMAVPDLESCRIAFLEACNARYEPQYAGLEAAGALQLSAEGLAACAAHLETVACEQQLFDLDGGCAGVWEGLGTAGDPCGPGLESFVCDGDHTCVVTLDFCGTCEPAVAVGEPCEPGEVRCAGAAACVDGTCVARGLPGEPCGDAAPCVVAATCVDGTCRGFTTVAEGDACDRARRCPYRAACVEGRCVATPLLGAACDPAVGCASGRCVDGTCEPLLDDGAPCTRAADCRGGLCDGTCRGLPSGCFSQ